MPHMTECAIRVRRAVIAQQGNDVPQANDAVLVKVFGTIVRFRLICEDRSSLGMKKPGLGPGLFSSSERET